MLTETDNGYDRLQTRIQPTREALGSLDNGTKGQTECPHQNLCDQTHGSLMRGGAPTQLQPGRGHNKRNGKLVGPT